MGKVLQYIKEHIKTDKIISILIALAIVVVTCIIMIIGIARNYTIYRFDEETLKYVFAHEVSSAESFCQNKGADTVLYGRYTYAKANKDGSLTLVVDNETLRIWKSSEWFLQILESLLEEEGRSAGVDIDWSDDFLSTKKLAKSCGIEISEDYSLITESPGDDVGFFPFLTAACVIMQIFEGKQIGEVYVRYIEVDESGNIVDEIVWEQPVENAQ
ncbi:MAG: hypothetical protein E7584_06145 [Ruminococcaceae bacterium]|nr:hypothetical protein [Oscillospiraceae bacterium]